MTVGAFPSHMLQIASTLWDDLTSPSTSVQHVGQRHLARMLAALLLVALPVALIFVVMQTYTSTVPVATLILGIISLAILVVAYLLSRTRFFVIGTWITVFTITFAAWVTGSVSSSQVTQMLLSLSSLVATLLLTTHPAVIAVVGNLFSALPLALLSDPQTNFAPIMTGDIVFLVVFSAILMVFIWLRRVHLQQLDAQSEKLLSVEQHRVELALQQERLAVIQQFIRDVSHDFKTPLSVINTGVYMLRKSNNPEKREYYLNALEEQSRRMTELLDQLRTMSRLGSQTEFALEPIDVNQLIVSIGDNMQPIIQQQHLALRLELAAELPQVNLDGVEISRALINLIENAIHHTAASGTITVHTSLCEKCIAIEVRDTGEGIQPQDLPRVFDPFYRSSRDRSAQTGGIGLGLSIVQRIVEAHGGQVTAESRPGAGSCFRVTLPVGG